MVHMILRDEINAKAKEFEIHPTDVEKDYVFGWLLFGLFTQSALKKEIFLKGGNALRKGYFENTRFSSDLDLGIEGDMDQSVLLLEINILKILFVSFGFPAFYFYNIDESS